MPPEPVAFFTGSSALYDTAVWTSASGCHTVQPALSHSVEGGLLLRVLEPVGPLPHAPGGRTVYDDGLEWYRRGAHRHHLDGTLAPKRWRWRHGGALCWQGQGTTKEESERVHYDADELPQGQFLRHVL